MNVRLDGTIDPRQQRSAAVTQKDGSRPEWLLPPGVAKGVWDYAHAAHIAAEYDDTIAGSRLFLFDEQVIARHCRKPGVVVDLGCGTGRALIPLAKRGFYAVGVDLSLHMLRIVRAKARAAGVTVHTLRANLVELECLADRSADYVLCLFSTLGMIYGRENRRRVLAHVRRILKSDGTFILHVHNVWHNLLTPAGRGWLWRHWLETRLLRRGDFGDRFFEYHGVANVFVHAFTWRELRCDLHTAGLKVRQAVPLSVDRNGPLGATWFFGSVRANGWVLACSAR